MNGERYKRILANNAMPLLGQKGHVHLGGQTPLKLAIPLEEKGVKIIGTSPESIDLAEDRERFRDLILELGLKQPKSGVARSEKEAGNGNSLYRKLFKEIYQ